jgi:hypothetical protein
MSDDPNGAGLFVEDDHFVLSRGGERVTTLSFDEVLAIANQAPTLREIIQTRRPAMPGAVFVTPVSATRALWDALGENVLLQLAFAPNEGSTFELSAQRFAELREQLNELAAQQPSFRSSQ